MIARGLLEWQEHLPKERGPCYTRTEIYRSGEEGTLSAPMAQRSKRAGVLAGRLRPRPYKVHMRPLTNILLLIHPKGSLQASGPIVQGVDFLCHLGTHFPALGTPPPPPTRGLCRWKMPYSTVAKGTHDPFLRGFDVNASSHLFTVAFRNDFRRKGLNFPYLHILTLMPFSKTSQT